MLHTPHYPNTTCYLLNALIIETHPLNVPHDSSMVLSNSSRQHVIAGPRYFQKDRKLNVDSKIRITTRAATQKISDLQTRIIPLNLFLATVYLPRQHFLVHIEEPKN